MPQCEKDVGRVARRATEISEFMLMPQLVNKTVHLLILMLSLFTEAPLFLICSLEQCFAAFLRHLFFHASN